MKICIIVPGFNEEAYIHRVLQRIKKYKHPVIFVDDGSRDNTVHIASKSRVHILRHKVNIGKGAAMKTGAMFAFSKLKADAIIFMDADDQHDAREIPRFCAALSKYDVVFGVRRLGASVPLLRFLGNKSVSILLHFLFGVYIPDIPSGYKAFHKKAFEEVEWNSSGYEVETEIAVRVAEKRLRFTTVEIEAIYHEHDKGMTILDALHICRCMLVWRIGL